MSFDWRPVIHYQRTRQPLAMRIPIAMQARPMAAMVQRAAVGPMVSARRRGLVSDINGPLLAVAPRVSRQPKMIATMPTKRSWSWFILDPDDTSRGFGAADYRRLAGQTRKGWRGRRFQGCDAPGR